MKEFKNKYWFDHKKKCSYLKDKLIKRDYILCKHGLVS